jgi:hypothetical protein
VIIELPTELRCPRIGSANIGVIVVLGRIQGGTKRHLQIQLAFGALAHIRERLDQCQTSAKFPQARGAGVPSFSMTMLSPSMGATRACALGRQLPLEVGAGGAGLSSGVIGAAAARLSASAAARGVAACCMGGTGAQPPRVKRAPPVNAAINALLIPSSRRRTAYCVSPSKG